MPTGQYSKEITHNTGRVFVIGDLHGEIDKLYAAMESVNFNYDEDIIIAVGDLVDRGPKSLECFNLIYKSWFKTVRGNHEQFCLDRVYGSTPANIHESNGGEWFSYLPEDVQVKIADEVEQLPIVLTLNRNNKRYGFVHGDIPIIIKDWNELVSFLSGPSKDTYATQCLWGRTRIKQTMNTPLSLKASIDNIASVRNVDQIYIGHTVIKDIKTLGNMTFIDTGACFDNFGYGKLTIIELE